MNSSGRRSQSIQETVHCKSGIKARLGSPPNVIGLGVNAGPPLELVPVVDDAGLGEERRQASAPSASSSLPGLHDYSVEYCTLT